MQHKKLFWLFIAILGFQSLQASERSFQEKWCDKHNGLIEYRLPDGTRVDCITEHHAVEFDYAGKWEAVAQALHYAKNTGKKAAIAYICRDTKKDLRKITRISVLIDYYNLPIRILKINCND